ncbi:hypothetical protein GCM10009864_59320 [Streptomyces lunalinharesii]|uniref:Uncharacterized protein n=1 Tax=Streptomyces lunalinharesii TaxID=333384 RepID=A0ABN3SK18_9ACTN
MRKVAGHAVKRYAVKRGTPSPIASPQSVGAGAATERKACSLTVNFDPLADSCELSLAMALLRRGNLNRALIWGSSSPSSQGYYLQHPTAHAIADGIAWDGGHRPAADTEAVAWRPVIARTFEWHGRKRS